MLASIGPWILSLTCELKGFTLRSSSSSSSTLPSGNMLKELKGLTKDLEETANRWKGVSAALADAEMRQIQDESVREWLHDLRVWVDKVGNLMDEYEYEAVAEEASRVFSREGERCSAVSSRSPLLVSPSFRQEVANRLRELKKQFRDIAKRRESLQLTQAAGGRFVDDPFADRSPCGSLPGNPAFFGREKELQELRDLLLDGGEIDRENVKVVAVIGMGGIGKTTLAQHLYNDPDITNSFMKGWVSVTEKFDVAHLLKATIESLNQTHCQLSEVSALQVTVKTLLENEKKLLLVLDDVWNENAEKWDTFIAPFVHAAKRGSKILLTTRVELVARRSGAVNWIRLGNLSGQDGWALLRERAFRCRDPNVEISMEIAEMGREIVRKCAGLPLAIKAVGGLLNSMGSDKEVSWRDVKESGLLGFKHEEGARGILGSLYLSYLHLPPKLKTCFQFCSIISQLRLPVKRLDNLNRPIKELRTRSFLEGF